MTTFNTGNPLGSTDVYDRYDNSENLDNFSNGPLDAYPDRFGVSRQSLQGIRNASQYVDLGPYAAGLVLTSRNQVFSYGGEFYAPGPAITLPYTTTGAGAGEIANFRSVGDAMLRADLAATDGAATLVGGALHKGEALDPTPAGTSLTRGASFAYYPLAPLAGAIRMGASDLTSLNDERNFWRGLPSQNAWGDPANMGFASAAFNRNGASIGSYSTTFGHDCVTYGTASIAGGAGCATGNPDLPIETGNFTGYCAIAFGKNSIAIGEKSACFGEEHLINTRAGIGLGYAVVSQPSVTGPTPAGAAGIGRSINLFGQAYAFGANLSASDGVVVGFGPSPGTVLHSGEERAVTIGAGTELGAVRIVEPLSGQIRSQVAINCQRLLDPNVETRIDLGDGKTLGIVTDSFGSSKFSLRGLKGDGTTQPIVDFEWSNPNSGSSAGSLSVKMNGRSTVAFGLLADGTPIFQELKDAAGISGAPSGAVYKDGGFLKLVP